LPFSLQRYAELQQKKKERKKERKMPDETKRTAYGKRERRKAGLFRYTKGYGINRRRMNELKFQLQGTDLNTEQLGYPVT
jgi:hypothetical protein